MILIDTSVWIDVFSGKLTLTDDELSLGIICLPVYQEVLQGIRSDLQLKQAKRFLEELGFIHPLVSRAEVDRAVELYRSARKVGITIRSSVDCLIAAIAEHHQVRLWSLDRDFDRFLKISSLQRYSR